MTEDGPPLLWSAEEPNLYVLVLVLLKGTDQVIEAESCQVRPPSKGSLCAVNIGILLGRCSSNKLKPAPKLKGGKPMSLLTVTFESRRSENVTVAMLNSRKGGSARCYIDFGR